MRYFHDEEYDGVVLKLPAVFIQLNQLEGTLDKLKETLEERSQYSLHHPDWEKTVNELEDWKTKKENIQARKELEKEQQRKRHEYEQQRLRGEVLEVDWRDVKDGTDWNVLELGGDEYDFEQLFRMNRVTQNKIFETLCSLNDKNKIDFMQHNGFMYIPMLVSELEYGKYWCWHSKPVYVNNLSNITLRVRVMKVRRYIDNNRYYLDSIEKREEDGKLIVRSVYKDIDDILLDDYEFKQGKFYRK